MSKRKPTPIHRDEVVQRVVQMRGLLGMLREAEAARDCPTTRQAAEKCGEVGCPLCGARADLHRSEAVT